MTDAISPELRPLWIDVVGNFAGGHWADPGAGDEVRKNVGAGINLVGAPLLLLGDAGAKTQSRALHFTALPGEGFVAHLGVVAGERQVAQRVLFGVVQHVDFGVRVLGDEKIATVGAERLRHHMFDSQFAGVHGFAGTVFGFEPPQEQLPVRTPTVEVERLGLDGFAHFVVRVEVLSTGGKPPPELNVDGFVLLKDCDCFTESTVQSLCGTATEEPADEIAFDDVKGIGKLIVAGLAFGVPFEQFQNPRVRRSYGPLFEPTQTVSDAGVLLEFKFENEFVEFGQLREANKILQDLFFRLQFVRAGLL